MLANINYCHFSHLAKAAHPVLLIFSEYIRVTTTVLDLGSL